MPIGVPELLILLVVVLLIFGPKRLPQLGRQLGGGMREFRDSVLGRNRDEDDEDEDGPESRPALTAGAGDAARTPTGVQPRSGGVEQDDQRHG